MDCWGIALHSQPGSLFHSLQLSPKNQFHAQNRQNPRWSLEASQPCETTLLKNCHEIIHNIIEIVIWCCFDVKNSLKTWYIMEKITIVLVQFNYCINSITILWFSFCLEFNKVYLIKMQPDFPVNISAFLSKTHKSRCLKNRDAQYMGTKLVIGQ